MTPHVTELSLRRRTLQGAPDDGASAHESAVPQGGSLLAPTTIGRPRRTGRAGSGPGRPSHSRASTRSTSAPTRPARASARPVQRRSRDEEGFTLVELLVVVLVLGALIGIAVPTFVSQRDGAWDAAVRSELRAAGIALESYRAQNGEYDVAALASGAGWGYEDSGDLVFERVVSASAFCMIAAHREAGGSEPNRWRITQAGLEGEPVGPSATCGAPSGSGS
jgi:type IV pilus assembly protein PilA